MRSAAYCCLGFLCSSHVAWADTPAPYSLPWQLRPAGVASVVRSDTALAAFSTPDLQSGMTVVSTLLASYKVSDSLAPFVRVGGVLHAPSDADATPSFVNPVVGGTVRLSKGTLRSSAALAVALPFGMGGGNDADPEVAAATAAGVLTRSAMDNAMFAVNDLVLFPGFDLAWVKGGATLQLEVTLLQLIRVRGDEVQADASKTNSTMGIHAGYFVHPSISVGVEARYQRWLSTPSFVEATPAKRDTMTFAAGVRAHIPVGEGKHLRPGLAYARGLDDPMAASQYQIVQLDVPFAF